MITQSRATFAVWLRLARKHGTIGSYERDRQWRRATIAGVWHIYEPAYYSMLQRERGDDDGATYSDPRDAKEDRL